MYIHPQLLTRVYPSITSLSEATRLADAENASDRDVRPLMSILQRIATADPRIAGHCLTRKTAVGSFNWIIEGLDEEELMQISYLINRVIPSTVEAGLFGVFCAQVDWLKLEIIKKYKPVMLEKTESGLYILKEKGFSFSRIEPEEGDLYLIDETDWAGGALRSIAYHAVLKDDTVKEWANFNRKLKGLIQGKADEDKKADTAKALQQFVNNQAAVTDRETEFAFNSLTDSKGATSFKEFKESLENDIAIGLLGQADVTELPAGSGSRAALQVMNLIRSDIMYADMKRAEDLINGQFLLNYYKVNYNKKAEKHPWKFSFVFDETEDTEVNSRVITDCINNGIPLVKQEVYKKLGMSAPTDKDELLKVNSNGVEF